MDVKPIEPGEVIGYQIDNFTHTLSAEHLGVCLQVYPVFIDKVSPWTHFSWESGCEDYFPGLGDFEPGLYLEFIFTVTILCLIQMQHLKSDAIGCAVSSEFYHLFGSFQ